ncbi:MAG: ABC transporter permease [Bacteroidales bacterium]|jgi:D-methionine transport system permease protein|nr:ABC transporter permease [Bacteroidales bacterium]
MNRDPMELISQIVMPAFWDTLYMVIMATVISTIIGFFIGIILYVTDKDGLRPNANLYKVLDVIVNMIRSFPFIILVVSIIPITRAIVGTSIGKNAAIVPLVIAGSPFIARLIEGSLKDVDKGLVEAGKSFGASDTQIIFKIMVKEAIPTIINNITFAAVSILGTTAMAGTVGAGGLGAIAISYGYQNFNDVIMYGTVIILIVLVQVIQLIGRKIYRKTL